MLQEFKQFAMKGNVVDLAVGVVIGTAFGTIVNSLVGDIIMPVVGALTGNINFTGLEWKVGSVAIAYGKFLQSVFSFLVVAWALFIVVKAMNALRKKEECNESKAAAVKEDIKLLTEIRDLLKR
jgi:large conductance mechanosensitive channel